MNVILLLTFIPITTTSIIIDDMHIIYIFCLIVCYSQGVIILISPLLVIELYHLSYYTIISITY